MRRRIAVLAVALFAVTAGCSALPGTGSTGASASTSVGASQAASPAGETVAVGASGQVQAAPDRAVVRVTVTARADSAETVRRHLAENASRTRSALRDMGLDEEQITAARYDIGRNYEHEERPSAPKYRGQHGIAVTLDDTGRAGEVVVTAIENGATAVDEVRFTVTPGRRQELRRRALSAAVENARAKADVAAEGTGLSLAGVQTVRTGDVSVDPVRRQEVAYATAAGDAGGTSFEGGTVTVTTQVTVVYDATAA